MRYKVTLHIEVDGDDAPPHQWNWPDLIGETVELIECAKVETEEEQEH